MMHYSRRPSYHLENAQRTPCAFVLDTSWSMSSIVAETGTSSIQELNDGLGVFKDAVMSDDMAAMRVQVSIITVGGPEDDARLHMDWTDAVDFQPPQLYAEGGTPLAQGMRLALEAVERQKLVLNEHSIGFTRPWIMVITDGRPTDLHLWDSVTAECRAAESAGRCLIFPIGVGNADLRCLGQLSERPAIRMAQTRWRECFQWLSASLGRGVRSQPGGSVQLPAMDPWAVVSG